MGCDNAVFTYIIYDVLFIYGSYVFLVYINRYENIVVLFQFLHVVRRMLASSVELP